MAASRTISASEFKAKCLEILDRVGRREWVRVVITKRGRAVAALIPPPEEEKEIATLPGFMRDSVVIPPDVDLTEPITDEPFAAEEGGLHR
jgi:prevent-host-death family protein